MLITASSRDGSARYNYNVETQTRRYTPTPKSFKRCFTVVRCSAYSETRLRLEWSRPDERTRAYTRYPCQHKMEQVYLPSRSVHPKVFVSFHRHGRRPLRDVSATVSLLSLSVYSLARHTPVSPVPPAALSAVSECCRRCSSPEFIASGCFRQNSRKDSSCVLRLGCRLHDLLRVDPRCALHSTDT